MEHEHALKNKGFFADFKTLLIHGNALDLAVGIVLGTAFVALANSVINTVIMPIISRIFGKPSLANIAIGWFKIGTLIASIIGFILIIVFLVIALKMTLRWVKKGK